VKVPDEMRRVDQYAEQLKQRLIFSPLPSDASAEAKQARALTSCTLLTGGDFSPAITLTIKTTMK
jgi:hypothetical protein